MKNLRFGPLRSGTLEEVVSLIGMLLISFGSCLPARAQTMPSAQTAPAAQVPFSATEQQIPAAASLNLDSAEVAKEMSKAPHPDDVKPEVFSAAQSAFERSILNSESRKKVSGVVEAGAGVGTIPENRWHKAENVNCENAAVAIVDQISKNTQIGLAAQVDTCRVK